jgi:hypothetical protein
LVSCSTLIILPGNRVRPQAGRSGQSGSHFGFQG